MSFHSYILHIKNKVQKKWAKINRRNEMFENWWKNVSIDFSIHWMERSIFRLWISPNQVIEDIRINFNNAYRQKKEKQDKFLIIWKYWKYILDIRWVVITVLSLDMTPVDIFNKFPCKNKFLKEHKEIIPVFKRSKIIS